MLNMNNMLFVCFAFAVAATGVLPLSVYTDGDDHVYKTISFGDPFGSGSPDRIKREINDKITPSPPLPGVSSGNITSSVSNNH